ncbi:D-glycero-beta-D-manno-heptose-7-phosphate kinase [uncultured Sphingomonas sp.]|uniref:D-glycero-beta-D-manno-heptose-7-phosphate kinase n=1 Tax=uncultured Sphingomonas sp. TaxID=158754 RepID=UPI0025EC91C8|nr:D-glycero-beta-D-manno-heptose-7-phosphate kinase [uncultured Sphingomonas sp.]
MHSYIDQLIGCRVAVIGDLMLDSYLSGEVSRISPEAPVPVMRVQSEKSVPGGAANVAANLASLGLSVSMVGLAGQDVARDELVTALEKLGDVDCSGIIAAPGRRTTRKLRIIGAHQQIVRVDHEDVLPCTADVEDRFLTAAVAAIDAADVVIVSDYAKGVCSDRVLRQVLDHAAATAKKVVVDPKRADLAAYRGATVLTPNRKELHDATKMPVDSDEEVAAAVKVAQQSCGSDLLVTRSEKGMSFFPLDGAPVHLGTIAQAVFDVSGAGDTVVAVLAAALAAGLPFVEGMRMANHAAGIVVSKLGTASVTRAELAESLLAEGAPAEIGDGALVSRDDAVTLRWAWQREKLTVGFANGCFDLLHPGHVSLIRQAADSCDRLIMALNSDASVKRLKGPSRPIQDEQARAQVMGALKGVAAVVIFDEDTPGELIDALQPDVLVKGADYTVDQVVGADVVQARGGRVVLAQLSPGHSTSRLVAASAG